MKLRPIGLRLRGRWICLGFGAVCTAGLTIAGCSRSPLTSLGDLRKAPQADSADSVAQDLAAEREALAKVAARDPRQAAGEAATEAPAASGRTITGAKATSGNAMQRIFRRSPAETAADPFLAQENAVSPYESTRSVTEVPSTQSLAAGRSTAPGIATTRGAASSADQGIARTSHQRTAAAETRPAASEQPRITPAEGIGVARTTPVAERTSTRAFETQTPDLVRSTTQPHPSRLEQLRQQLREQQAAEELAAQQAAALPEVTPRETDRGYLLSTTTPAPVENRIEEAAAPFPRAQTVASSDRTQTAPASAGNDEVSLRVQSLLAAAEWQYETGDLQQAFRNAMLAQQLAQRHEIAIGPFDRRPDEVVQRIREARSLGMIADSAPPSEPAVQRQVASTATSAPKGAFPAGGVMTWRRAENEAAVIRSAEQQRNNPVDSLPALPRVEPQGHHRNTLSAEAAVSPALNPGTILPGQQTLQPPDVLSLLSEDPAPAPRGDVVTLAGIATDASLAGGLDEVVTAAAEQQLGIPQAYTRGDASPEPVGFTVPGMASLPKRSSAGPLLPSRLDPELNQPQKLETPPNLEIIGNRNLSSAAPPTAAAPTSGGGAWWGVAGLILGVLASAFAFRRGWSSPSRS